MAALCGLVHHRGKGIVQHQDRPPVAQRSGQRQPGLLSPGETDTAAADHGLFSLLHGVHLGLHAHRLQPGPAAAGVSQQDIFPNAVAQKLRLMAQIPYHRRNLQVRSSRPPKRMLPR